MTWGVVMKPTPWMPFWKLPVFLTGYDMTAWLLQTVKLPPYRVVYVKNKMIDEQLIIYIKAVK